MTSLSLLCSIWFITSFQTLSEYFADRPRIALSSLGVMPPLPSLSNNLNVRASLSSVSNCDLSIVARINSKFVYKLTFVFDEPRLVLVDFADYLHEFLLVLDYL